MNERCTDCMYFIDTGSYLGECHAFPPVNGWPRVSKDTWCGKFVERPKAPAQELKALFRDAPAFDAPKRRGRAKGGV